MKAAHKIAAALIITAIACVGTVGFWYLGYERSNEIARYQLGYAQGVEVGRIEQREDYRKSAVCYSLMTADGTAGPSVTICGIVVDPKALAAFSEEQ